MHSNPNVSIARHLKTIWQCLTRACHRMEDLPLALKVDLPGIQSAQCSAGRALSAEIAIEQNRSWHAPEALRMSIENSCRNASL